jgi:hypothetical protein
MPSVTVKTKALRLRALLIIGALVSLCVSDTVGPRLLPLPVATGHAASERQPLENIEITSAPSGGNSIVARESMAAPARKQAGAERHSPHVASHAACGLFLPTFDAVAFTHTTCALILPSSAKTTRPPGRAPPLSV